MVELAVARFVASFILTSWLRVVMRHVLEDGGGATSVSLTIVAFVVVLVVVLREQARIIVNDESSWRVTPPLR